MKYQIRKIAAVVLAAMMMFTLLTAVPFAAQAEEATPLRVLLKSNFFPEQTNIYTDLSQYEDENGDAFITAEYKMCAPEKYLINLDIDKITWDNTVLEFKEEYNISGSGRRKLLNIFPFAREQGFGTGVINTFGDDNGGKLTGNFSSVSPAAYGYEEDGSGVTVIRVVFKVLDRHAGTTTINCVMDTLSLDDETEEEPRAHYCLVSGTEIDYELYNTMATYGIVSGPETQKVSGDVSDNGVCDIMDVTVLQGLLAYFDSYTEHIDLGDPTVQMVADTNHDGKVDVRDVTEIQRYVAQMIQNL